MSKKNHTPMSVTVKDSIDLVFDLLTNNPDGYELNTKDFGYYGEKVIRILVGRGVISRRFRGRGKTPLYKWESTQAPNKVFYGSVCQELQDIIQAKTARYTANKKARTERVHEKETPVEAEEGHEAEAETAQAVPERDCIPLAKYSVTALWEELKRRGCFIKDGRLACVAYID